MPLSAWITTKINVIVSLKGNLWWYKRVKINKDLDLTNLFGHVCQRKQQQEHWEDSLRRMYACNFSNRERIVQFGVMFAHMKGEREILLVECQLTSNTFVTATTRYIDTNLYCMFSLPCFLSSSFTLLSRRRKVTSWIHFAYAYLLTRFFLLVFFFFRYMFIWMCSCSNINLVNKRQV